MTPLPEPDALLLPVETGDDTETNDAHWDDSWDQE